MKKYAMIITLVMFSFVFLTQKGKNQKLLPINKNILTEYKVS